MASKDMETRRMWARFGVEFSTPAAWGEKSPTVRMLPVSTAEEAAINANIHELNRGPERHDFLFVGNLQIWAGGHALGAFPAPIRLEYAHPEKTDGGPYDEMFAWVAENGGTKSWVSIPDIRSACSSVSLDPASLAVRANRGPYGLVVADVDPAGPSDFYDGKPVYTFTVHAMPEDDIILSWDN